MMEIPGPATPPADPRTMLRLHLARRAAAALRAGAREREIAIAQGTLHAWRAIVIQHARDMLGLGEPGALSAQPLNTRLVSRHEQQHHILENVLFNSIDGWRVNATLFLPKGPGPFPAIVVPCGHSRKSDRPHQLPPQVFARAGYAAITFDPPAQGGEKGAGNDHFTDGPRCYAVGQTSQRYFVADALRAMDYLASRADIDAARGFGMTGVSGGGQTTTWAALLDERVRLAAPVCCASRQEDHPIANLYACCTETLPAGRLALGIDDADLMAALAPLPQLYMHGRRDEVFTPERTGRVTRAVADVYAALGAAERFAVHHEDCGHDYTVSMARRFVAFADEYLLGKPGRQHPPSFHEDPQPEPAEAMLCHPSPDPNMRTISASRAAALRQSRPRVLGRADAARVVRKVVRGTDEARVTRVIHGPRSPVICSDLEELILEHEDGILLPATVIWPRDRGTASSPSPALVMFDDRGRWAPLRKQGWLTAVSRLFDREATAAPAVLSVDVRGWGDTSAAPGPFDVAGWSGLDRWTSFVSASLADPILAQRVRDGLAATRWLAGQPGIDPRRLVIAGHGLGGVVALMTAALTEHVAGVVTLDAPDTIESIVAAPSYAWPADVFLSHVLEYFDIPTLAEAVAPVLAIRPCDERMRPLREEPDRVAVEWVWKRMGI